MIQALADHIHKNAPAYVVGIFVSGFAFAGSASWFAYNLYVDVQMLLCKVGIERDDNRFCQWTSTLVEDLRKDGDGSSSGD